MNLPWKFVRAERLIEMEKLLGEARQAHLALHGRIAELGGLVERQQAECIRLQQQNEALMADWKQTQEQNRDLSMQRNTLRAENDALKAAAQDCGRTHVPRTWAAEAAIAHVERFGKPAKPKRKKARK